MVASKADIIAHESLGYSHLVYRGESYFVNLDSESSRLKFKEYLEKETGKEWDIADLERCVFYRKDMYALELGYLVLNNTFQGKVEIPINTVSCAFMFKDKDLEGVDFSTFDTTGVEDMYKMFENCFLPEDFSLGDNFDTSSVKDMYAMFTRCAFPKGFSLGDKFDTSNVENMCEMFSSAYLPEDFSLGDKFDTSRVRNMVGMFDKCTLPKDFSLGNRFATSSVENMYRMFYRCTLPKGFSLGNKFDTSKVKNMYGMFEECTFTEGFSLGDKFDTSSVENMSNMFCDAKFNEDFSLAKDFNICGNAEYMFLGAKLPSKITEQLSGEVTNEKIVELLKSTLVTKADFF